MILFDKKETQAHTHCRFDHLLFCGHLKKSLWFRPIEQNEHTPIAIYLMIYIISAYQNRSWWWSCYVSNYFFLEISEFLVARILRFLIFELVIVIFISNNINSYPEDYFFFSFFTVNSTDFRKFQIVVNIPFKIRKKVDTLIAIYLTGFTNIS